MKAFAGDVPKRVTTFTGLLPVAVAGTLTLTFVSDQETTFVAAVFPNRTFDVPRVGA